ncbi:hypothetical protein DAPPUDRAFT_121798 [Daphnia pulex]|uniref:Uncharacterized protein n=1 Tax=Daphnia pulex TaxID=6669 RepID=E9I3G3_DAPPU|nr:hypothetical protein DAPPUDRAFT_121798 [Daphnia pulex]|eukprot:EFX61467.1 hypothetical protein DAPPUDRAFT_121798 [Daphnia pulex]
MCLHIEHFLYDSLPSLMPCNKNSMRWGINEVTGQFMELHSLRCIENNKGRLYLGRCNDDQKPRSQKWKFEYHSPMLVNSTNSPRLTPSVMLEWHRNLSIYAIPFPPLPPIIQRANTIEPPIDEEDNTRTTPKPTTSTTTTTTPKPTTSTTTTTTPKPTTSTTTTTTPKPTTSTTTTTTPKPTTSTTTTTTPKPTTTDYANYDNYAEAHYVKYNYNDAETNYVYYVYNNADAHYINYDYDDYT